MAPLFWSRWKAKREGKKDGRLGYPESDHASQYEARRIAVAESTIDGFTRRYEREDKKLKEQYCEEMVALDNLNERIKAIEQDHQEAKRAEQERRKAAAPRPPVPVPISYWIIFAFLAVCEFPMNAAVFDILGEAKWLTYLLAAGLGVVIPLAAHFLGIQLRNESPFQSFRGALKALFIFLVVLAVLIGIAYIREKYVAGADIVKILGIKMDPRMVTEIFLSINLLIFMVATIASYFYHIDVTDEIKRERYHYERIRKASQKLLNGVSDNLKPLYKNRDELEESISRLRTARESIFNQWKARAKQICKTKEWLISLYRHENIKSRLAAGKGGEEPPSFKKKPEIDLGIFAGELDEDCGEEVFHDD